MKLYDAIQEMRRLSNEVQSFSFSFMSYNTTKCSSSGIVEVQNARFTKRVSEKHHKHADIVEAYIDLDTMEPHFFYQSLLLTFNNFKIEIDEHRN